MYGTRPLKIVRGPSGSPKSISSMYCVRVRSRARGGQSRVRSRRASGTLASVARERVALRARAIEAIARRWEGYRTHLLTSFSASSCLRALKTLPTRKSTRCSKGPSAAGFASARATTEREGERRARWRKGHVSETCARCRATVDIARERRPTRSVDRESQREKCLR